MRIILCMFGWCILLSCRGTTGEPIQKKEPLPKRENTQQKPVQHGTPVEVRLEAIGECDKSELADLKRKQNQPYAIRKNNLGDTTWISFRFVSDCCQEFKPVFTATKDTLLLSYIPAGNSFCECYCTYSYRFAIIHSANRKIRLRSVWL